MILGFGIDLLEKNRIEKVYNNFNSNFVEKILSLEELSLFNEVEDYNKKIYFLAKRFSVKEAFLKAVGIGMGRGILMKDITLKNNSFGKPELELIDRAKNFLIKYFNNIDYDKINFIVSITDEKLLINTAVIIDYDKY